MSSGHLSCGRTADLFSAMKLLNRCDVELTVLGAPILPIEFYKREYPDFVYEHTRSNLEVRQLMLTCDVLVLASIVEGRAMVQLEALSCGLPIIVTPNAGAEDLVEPGRTGFLVPIRAPES
jgi:glycosyltransferase involved in cell wall biosynthesis